MTYKNHLKPWCIIRSLPNKRSNILIRFRNHSDAEGHLKILRVNNPTASYKLIFDATLEHADSTTKPELPQSQPTMEESHHDSTISPPPTCS